MAERYVSALTGPEMDAALLDMAQHNSEAWAVGTRNGAAVSSSDDTYNNNSKYYATEAEAAAARAEAAVPAGTAGAVFFDRAQSLTDAQKVQARANISAGQGGTNPNLLDNPWFTINQRAITSQSANNGFICDRWKVTYGNGGVTASWSDGGVTVQSTSGASHGDILQPMPLELLQSLAGKTVTISAMLSDYSVRSGTLVCPSDRTTRRVGLGRGLDGNKITAAIYNNLDGTSRSVQIWKDKTAETYRAVKLEIGSISTLANDALPNYAGELLKCQRYFLRVLRNGGYFVDVGFGVADSTNTARITIPTPVPMAKSPTVSMSGTVRIQSGGSGHEITNISNYQSITNVGVQIHPTTSGLTNGENVILSLGSNGAYIDLSADL